MGLPPPAELNYVKRDASVASFLVGDGHIIAGQYMWPADTAKLQQILKR